MITFFAVAFHNSYPPFFFFVFLSTYFFHLEFVSLLGRKYAEFIRIFGLLNIVTTLHNKRE